MTEKEGKDRLVYYIYKRTRNSGWFIFSKRRYELTFTRILEPHEKSANLPLPNKLHLQEIDIDETGILYRKEEFLNWEAICVTGTMSEYIPNGWMERGGEYKQYLLVILHSGDIIPFMLGDISHLKGLLGHFVEWYKTKKNNLTLS